jgi:photosystem II stability/assembly factor-like uncharacterized protein
MLEHGVYKSLDAGGAWARAATGIRASNIGIYALAVDPQDSGILYIATTSGRLYKSTDRGANWASIGHNLPDAEQGWIVQDIELDPENPSTIYVCTGYGVFRSPDRGLSWTSAGRIPSGSAHRLSFDPTSPGILYAAADNGVWRSANGGVNWSPAGTALNGKNVFGLVFDPRQTGTMFASLWSPPSDDPYLFKTTNGGANWTPLAAGVIRQAVRHLEIDAVTPTTLFAGNDDGLYRSVDAGASWSLVDGGFEQTAINCLAIDRRDPRLIYVATAVRSYPYNGIVYRSEDGGRSWWRYDNGIPSGRAVSVMAIDPSDSSTVYAGGEFGLGLYGTTGGFPRLILDRHRLDYGAAPGGAVTSAQRFTISSEGEGILSWNASTGTAWITLSSAAGTGPAKIAVAVSPAGLPVGVHEGEICVWDNNAADSPQFVRVVLTVHGEGSDAPASGPFGSLDSPLDGALVAGSIAVTGWALDDIEVVSVKLYRDPVMGEGALPVYIGDGVFVDGARPDVETSYPTYPFSGRAGWGYMLLTNFLPGQGNGTFALHAIARDREGRTREIGVKSITVNNARAVKPFGAIDTPGQGGTAFGSDFLQFGWALTPQPNMIPVDGSTITVWVDGQSQGHPSYGHYREDVASAFPGYANTDGAIGVFHLNTAAFADGVHSIAWSVRDDAGNEDGVGSRFFTIFNGASGAGSSAPASVNTVGRLARQDSFLPADRMPVLVRKGYQAGAPEIAVQPEADGSAVIAIRELERVEIDLSPLVPGRRGWKGGLKVGESIRALPAGSSLDAFRGTFAWIPGPGFLGAYELVFESSDRTVRKVRIIIEPRLDPKVRFIPLS